MIHLYMSKVRRHLLFRIAFAVLLPLAGLLGLWYYKNNGTILVCLVYSLTGLYCPGCGSGRALHALIRWDILQAVDYNVFFVLVLPFLGYYFFKRYIEIVLDREVLPAIFIPVKVTVVILSLVLIYTLVRNIPIAPYSLLAP